MSYPEPPEDDGEYHEPEPDPNDELAAYQQDLEDSYDREHQEGFRRAEAELRAEGKLT